MHQLDVAVGDIQSLHAPHKYLLIAGYRDVDSKLLNRESRAL